MNDNEKKETSSPVAKSDAWKMAHTMDKKEVEIERDQWKTRYESADIELIKERKKNRLLESEVAEWQRRELANREVLEEKDPSYIAKQERQEKLNRFLKRIK